MSRVGGPPAGVGPELAALTTNPGPTPHLNPSLTGAVRRQHGVVTAEQLDSAGWSRAAIRNAVDRDRLVLLHRGVYAFGPVIPERGHLLAAVLACGPAAALSHRSAVRVHGHDPGPFVGIDVTVARTRAPALAGVNVHRSRLAVRSVRRHGIPVSDIHRTLIDLADLVPYDVLHRIAMDAEHRGQVRLAALRPVQGRAGKGALLRLLDHVRERTRSELEKEALRIVRRAGLPDPQRNVQVGRFTVDLAWPAERVVVEADGWEAHGSRTAFEADRTRDLELMALGWIVLRVTWRQLRDRPELLIEALGVAVR